MAEAVGRRRALVVGVSTYGDDSGLDDLRAPLRDVEGMAQVLGSSACRFEVEPLRNPDCKSLQRAVEKLYRNAERDDVVMFYFSGHSKLDNDRRLYLCTTDTDDYLSSSAVDVSSWLPPIINSSRAAQVIILLDCCYSGAALKSGDVTAVLNDHLGKGRGKYLLASSTFLQESLEQPTEECSLFTKWLIQGLHDGAADQNGDQIITIEELHRFVATKVGNERPDQQPQGWGSGDRPGETIIAWHAGASGSAAPLQPLYPDFFTAVQRYLEQGTIIPFLGTEIYGDETLNSFALATALMREAGLPVDEDQPLATAAEYLERYYDDRNEFLTRLRRILDERSKIERPMESHDLILSLKPPIIIISATYDQVLEQRFEQSGKPYVMVAHILRSADGVHDGKILVVRRGEQVSVDIKLADEVILNEQQDSVIYKVLGSPFLHDYVDPALEIDTVVATEFDHATFVGRLENQHMTVPTVFSMPFKKRRLLFLGYTLDVWQYRLIMQVFGKSGKKRYAVRQPTSSMESLSWQRLGAELIRMDPGAFSQAVIALREPA